MKGRMATMPVPGLPASLLRNEIYLLWWRCILLWRNTSSIKAYSILTKWVSLHLIRAITRLRQREDSTIEILCSFRKWDSISMAFQPLQGFCSDCQCWYVLRLLLERLEIIRRIRWERHVGRMMTLKCVHNSGQKGQRKETTWKNYV